MDYVLHVIMANGRKKHECATDQELANHMVDYIRQSRELGHSGVDFKVVNK